MTYAGKLQKVVTLYLKKCSDKPAFTRGKPSQDYWRIRGYFFKQDPDIVNIVYDFLLEMPNRDTVPPWTIIDRAKAYQTELRWKEIKEEKVKKHEAVNPYSFDSLMNL